jgi:hypothetical protein
LSDPLISSDVHAIRGLIRLWPLPGDGVHRIWPDCRLGIYPTASHDEQVASLRTALDDLGIDCNGRTGLGDGAR